MINKSEQISNLAAALLKAQKEIGFAPKGAENPFYHSTYADLSSVIQSVKEPLNNNGIAFLQAVDSADIEGMPVVDTILLHESGQYLSTRTPVYCNKPNDPQAFGSGITYAKRYALQALLGLPTADDDGEAAMSRNNKKTTPKDKKQSPKPEEDQEALKAEFEQRYFNFQTEHSDLLQKEQWHGYIFDAAKYKIAFKKLKPKNHKWTMADIKALWDKVDPEQCLIKMSS